MKKFLLLTLLAAGCDTGSLEGGRYACTFDGGGVNERECPDDWRCGFEGYCHRFGDTSVAWRCTDDSHCENYFKCGLAESLDAGECHDPKKTQAFACMEDKHCSAGWRCSSDHRCVDAALDGLVVGPVSSFGAATQINPVADAAPDAFALSTVYDSGFGKGRETTVVARNGQLTATIRNTFDPAVFKRYELGLWNGRTFAAMGSRGEYIESQTNIIYGDDESRVFTVIPDGGVDVHTLYFDDGGVRLDHIALVNPASRLSVGSTINVGDLSPRVLAFGPRTTNYTVLYGGGSNSQVDDKFDHTLPGPPWVQHFPADGELIALTSVRKTDYLSCTLAVDQRGLWTEDVGGIGGPYAFEAVHLPPFTNDTCSPPNASTQRISGVTPLGSDWLGVRSRAADAGEMISALDLRGLWTDGPDYTNCSNGGDDPCTSPIPIKLAFGPCVACPEGTQLLDFALVSSGAGLQAEVRCGSSDGGTTAFFTVTPVEGTTACKSRVNAGPAGLFSKHSSKL